MEKKKENNNKKKTLVYGGVLKLICKIMVLDYLYKNGTGCFIDLK